MKVLNLQCAAQHVFEGWFASEEDYASQTARGLLECPLCGDKAVHKLPSAPRLNLGAPRAEAAPPADVAPQQVVSGASDPALQALQAAWLQAARRIMAETEDVGTRFAEEARKIHYGEAEERGIRGQASREEMQALREEGVDVLALPIPEALKEPLQ
jgi:hypothetical protein